jgi:hypothetical protein
VIECIDYDKKDETPQTPVLDEQQQHHFFALFAVVRFGVAARR